MDGSIRVADDGAVRRLTIDRPAKKNAFTAALYQALVDALRAADQDPAVRAVLLTGSEGVFTAGNDVADFLQSPPLAEGSPVLQLLLLLVDLQKPLVAAVDGPAIGIGTTLLLHADHVVATARARFQVPFVNLGLTPEGGSSLLLPLRVGPALANRLLLFGEPMSGTEAHSAGLVDALAAPDQLEAAALQAAQALAAKPPGALLATKAVLRAPLRAQVRQAILDEARVFAERLRSDEAREAFAAFLGRKR